MRRGPIIFSASFHVVMLIVAIFGLPFLAHREFIIPPPITVDFIEVAKVTETNKVTPQPVAPPEKPEPPKPEEKAPPPAPKNTANQAVVPVPKEPPKPEEKKEVKKEPKETVDPDALPDKNKKLNKKQEVAKKEPPKDFSSVLKNLAAPKEKMTAQELLNKLADRKAQPTPGQNAPIGERMTMSEQDALRAQLERCWNVPFGAKDAENMAVDVFMVINPDRTLREARIVDTIRYNTDSFFRAAADSALRAVRSPLCSPFELPPDKYSTWNTVTVTFNPKDMF